MISESQERMVAVVEPGRVDEVREVCDRWELPCTVIGEVTDHGDLRAFFDGEHRRLDPGNAPHRRVPALRRREARPPGRGGAGRTRQSRAQDLGLRAVRPARRLAHRTPSRARRRSAANRRDPRDRCVARRPAARLPRSTRGRLARGDGCRDERRLRRGRAARAHRLPQLRQPGEAGDRLGGRTGDRRDLARCGIARDSRRVGKRVAVQRDRRQSDPAHPRHRLRRPRARRDAHTRPVAER